MALFDIRDAVTALDDLLDHERQMILSGKIDALLKMGPEKERLLTRLPRSIKDPDTLARIQAKAERNQELLLNAAKGVRSVARKIEAMKAPKRALSTYGADGASSALNPGRSGFDRKA